VGVGGTVQPVIDFGGVPLVRLRWKPSWPLSLAEQFDPDVTLDCHRRPVPGGLPQRDFLAVVLADEYSFTYEMLNRGLDPF